MRLATPLTGYCVEPVTKRMSAPCATCQQKPRGRRLVVKEKGFRNTQNTVFCVKCGVHALDKIIDRLVTMRDEIE